MNASMILYLPVAVLSLSKSFTVILTDDGLLRTSTSCGLILFSFTLYSDCLKDTVVPTQ